MHDRGGSLLRIGRSEAPRPERKILMEIFDMREFDGHEMVVFGHDAPTGLRALIAIHSTTLGPAAGGCRLWSYATAAEATADALRLARGMSYKNAMAGLKF